MNAERLLAHYEEIADAPDAIARLRRFVLDLAVRGKLVPQDPNDEAASELLKRIAKEKARLVKAGEIRKPPTFEPITDAEALYALPRTWGWVRVGDIFDYDAGTKRDPKELDQSRWLLELEDIEKDTSRIVERLRVSDRDSQSTKSEFEPGDILYGKLRPYLNKVVVADEPGYSTTEIVAIRPFLRLCPEYCVLAFRRPDFVTYVERLGRGTKMPRLRTPDAIVAPFPLPPLAEQNRIVAKVDELMALCDRLEAARQTREATRDKLTAASLARLNAPDPDTFRADARFALDALPALTTRPDQIKDLRQTILNLAVRSKLVPQDANDESGSELLKRIAKEIPASKAGNPRAEPLPYGAPQGWVWTHLGRLVAHSDAGWSPKTHDNPRSGDEWAVLKVSAVSWDKFRAWENKQVLPGTEPRLQAEVKQGDFLISRANTAELIARAVIVDEPPSKLMMSDKIVRLRLSANCNHRFVWMVNNYADFAREHYVRHASGVSPSMKNVSRDVILSLPFPLPPLAEQHRIVAKVDALMALCDRLEASLTAAADTRRRLLDALLAEALAPADDRELEAAE
jgi:type I restriction enzyme S subunit